MNSKICPIRSSQIAIAHCDENCAWYQEDNNECSILSLYKSIFAIWAIRDRKEIREGGLY